MFTTDMELAYMASFQQYCPMMSMTKWHIADSFWHHLRFVLTPCPSVRQPQNASNCPPVSFHQTDPRPLHENPKWSSNCNTETYWDHTCFLLSYNLRVFPIAIQMYWWIVKHGERMKKRPKYDPFDIRNRSWILRFTNSYVTSICTRLIFTQPADTISGAEMNRVRKKFSALRLVDSKFSQRLIERFAEANAGLKIGVSLPNAQMCRVLHLLLQAKDLKSQS